MLPDPAVQQILQNAVNLQRVHNAIARDTSGVLRQLFDELAAEIARADPTGVRALRYRRDRVEKLLERVEKLTGEAFADWHRDVRRDLARLGRQQGEQAVQLLRVSLADAANLVRPVAPTQPMLKAILEANPFQGETLRGWADVQKEAVIRRTRQQVQIGMMGEESIGDIVRRVRGRSDGRGGYTGGVMKTTTREAESIVRTAVTEIASEAAFLVYQENSRLGPTYTYTATLDSRTTLICASLDGRVFAYDDPEAKRPPQHWQCRSFIVPNIDWAALGLEAPEEGERFARDQETGRRTQVPAGMDYEAWLRAQPAAVQAQILGPGRARLFQQGVTLRDMVRGDNSIVTLDELDRRAA